MKLSPVKMVPLTITLTLKVLKKMFIKEGKT
jgi:hypothetical protein